ncbi:hypothetical protein F8M41_000551 [Gigaspora margarita]|uniref:Serine-threonine/tyrosine-protein kinase catalytic domain-containing protein n=1 Tax=Gigaspora margarita TaxID=4874 RepID=A0A8H4AZM2_GIGMA|nr:hypothetical protein F8M41_000551 [Gigaspora margarita]
MKQCWDSDPLKRPDLSSLIQGYKEMYEEYKQIYEKPTPKFTPRKDSNQVNIQSSEDIDGVTSNTIPPKGSKSITLVSAPLLKNDDPITSNAEEHEDDEAATPEKCAGSIEVKKNI